MDLSRTFHRKNGGYVCNFCGCTYSYELAIQNYCDICHRCLNMSRNGRSFEISEPCCKCDFIKDEYGKWIEVENNRTGGVYFIRCGNAVKIGMANDVKKRLDGLQTANHEKLELLAVIKTVNKDVEITRNLFYFAKENGYLKYIDKAGETKTVELEVTL